VPAVAASDGAARDDAADAKPALFEGPAGPPRTKVSLLSGRRVAAAMVAAAAASQRREAAAADAGRQPPVAALRILLRVERGILQAFL